MTLVWVRELRLAFVLLTRIPVGRLRGDLPSPAVSSWSWPIVGVAVGAISALTFLAAARVGLPPGMSAILTLLATAIVTGAMHEDALADLADGFGGGSDRASKLRIMRDSRIGAYGVLALTLALGFRAMAIVDVASPGQVALALIALAAATRGALPVAMVLMPAARDDGLGHAARGGGTKRALAAAVLGAACLIPLGATAGLAVAGAIAAAVACIGVLAMRQIGGQTGDVLGAMQQLAECAGWAVLVVLL